MPDRIIQVPAGKRVSIHSGGQPIKGTEGVDIILEEDISLNLSSNFSPLVGGGSSKALTMLGGVLKDTTGFGFSGQFKQLGFQIWNGTDPLSTTFTVGFHMRNNAWNDVVIPTQALAKLPLPIDAAESEGDSGFGLIPPGPSILEALNAGEDDEGRATRGRNLSCRIGYIWLPSIIVKNAQPTFSNECDENGYPIWSKVSLTIDTLFTATTSLIDDFDFETETEG